ncbi:hypothetical protein AA313_de0206573 [Arthrobotrys entomopaga]|nr:hypothetical protein AA313_de0206573 [Arthrobotrys entomopaga]
MEHILLVDKTLFPLRIFPFVGEKWDGGSFDDYPQRRQYDLVTRKFLTEGVDNSPEASYSFFQTWLYFGLLSDIFLCPDANEQFLRYDDTLGCLVLTTENLSEVAERWKATVNSMEIFDKVAAINRAIKAIRRAHRELEEVEVPDPSHLIWEVNVSPLGVQVRFAIALLCDSLGYAILSLCNQDGLEKAIDKYNSKRGRENEILKPGYPYHRWRILSALDEAMDKALLCPVEKAQFENSSPAYLCYLLSLPETNRHPGQHSDCKNGTCVGNNIDEATYVTRHVMPDCGCEFDGPNIEDVKSCLEDGHIPSLSISIVNGEYQGMVVKPQKVEQPSIWKRHQNKSGIAKSLNYVALSHVWSDGLGNPVANTLPRCQLRRLAYYVNYTMKDGRARGIKGGMEKMFNLTKHIFSKREGTVWEQDPNFEICIWVDTMCVPLQKEYRKLAIQNMNQVYRQARYVMVLDASIARHDFRTDEELMGRVVLSTWMRRVWTLQEAVLGMEKLAICFKNHVVDQTDSVERLRLIVAEGNCSVLDNVRITLAILGDDGFAGLNGAVSVLEANKRGLRHFDPAVSSEDREQDLLRYVGFLERLWTLVGRRATTKEEDRVLVACNIFYKDVTKVLKGDGHTGRMTALLDQFEEVPAGVIFKTGERVPVDGYRWARHYFGLSSWGRFDFSNPGIVTPQGLLVKFPGFILPEKPTTSEFPLMVEKPGKQEFYIVNCNYPNASGTHQSPEDWKPIIERNENRLAIIVQADSYFSHVMLLKDGGNFPCKQRRAILVSITEEKKGTIYCRYESFIYLSEAPSVDYEPLALSSHRTVFSYDSRTPDQQWCVG